MHISSDAHISIVFYTGRERLSSRQKRKMKSFGNLFIHYGRPESWIDMIAEMVVELENHRIIPLQTLYMVCSVLWRIE